jgi:hypothetical protein
MDPVYAVLTESTMSTSCFLACALQQQKLLQHLLQHKLQVVCSCKLHDSCLICASGTGPASSRGKTGFVLAMLRNCYCSAAV